MRHDKCNERAFFRCLPLVPESRRSTASMDSASGVLDAEIFVMEEFGSDEFETDVQ